MKDAPFEFHPSPKREVTFEHCLRPRTELDDPILASLVLTGVQF